MHSNGLDANHEVAAASGGDFGISADGRSDADVEYLKEKGIGKLIDAMIRDMVTNTKPLNPGQWILRYLKQKMDNKQDYAPPKLWVSARRAGILNGKYMLSGRYNGMPFWSCGECRLYSTASGWWMITEDEAKMELNSGIVSSARPHEGSVLPHVFDAWEIVQQGKWVSAAVSITDTLIREDPAQREPSDSPQSASSPHFSPGRWANVEGVKPPGAGMGGDFLPAAVTSKPVHRACTERFIAGHASLQGWRAYNEDTFAMDKHGFFAVCDGHAGADVARIVAQRLPALFLDQSWPVDPAAVTQFCRELDDDILSPSLSSLEGGSTAAFAALLYDVHSRAYTVQVGHVGDSRILAWSRESASLIYQSADHTPNEPLEMARLAAGGFKVEGGRIDKLAVSRSFGDRDEKALGVIADPDVRTFECSEGDVIILASDGVFEHGTSTWAMDTVLRALDESEGDSGVAAASLCDHAFTTGSTDNISCTVIHLTDGHLSPVAALPKAECVPGPYSAAWDPYFRRGYEQACRDAGVSLAEALEQRYDDVSVTLSEMAYSEDAQAILLRDEFALFHNDAAAIERLRAARGTERTAWFARWAEKMAEEVPPY
ncbi:Protein phosphatase 2C [Diplonema papillatum]|nr:Protein phosphatase 2C [Diplonema papillatum]